MSFLRRLVGALALIFAGACIGAGYLGLRALIWRQDYLVNQMSLAGAVIGVALASLYALAYLLIGGRVARTALLYSGDLEFGAFLGALLFGVYHAAAPLNTAGMSEPVLQRFLQGAVDGVFIGVFLGIGVSFLNRHPLVWRIGGLIRYIVLYGSLLLLFGVIALMGRLLNVSEVALVVVLLPALAVLRVAVLWLDRRYGGG